MKTKTTRTHLWVKVTAFYLMLPIYLSILLGMFKLFGQSGEYKTFFGILPTVVVIAVLLSAIFLIRSGKLAIPLIVVAVFLFSAMMIGEIGGFKLDRGGKTQWTIEGDFKIPGIDVYCNDVHLGQTPLIITEDEFLAKVKLWDTPPSQQRTTLREDDHNDDTRFGWAQYMWIPSDFIEYTKRWPDEEMQRPLWGGIQKDAEIFEFCKKTPYWWRFEKNGCVGLSSFKSLLSWGGSGGPFGAKLSTGSTVKFPSLDKHFEVFIADLKRNNWQPDQAWMKHFAAYKDMLFGKLYQYAQKHPQAKPALDAVVRQEMNIPKGELSDGQRRQILDDVLRRCEEKSEFRIPSFESEASLLACRDKPEMIGEYYKKSMGRSRGGRISSSGSYIRYGNPGPAIRLPVMRWVVNQYQPPQLYNQLVYSVGNNAGMSRWFGLTDLKLVLNYPRDESKKILRYYLKTKQNQKAGPFGRAHDNEDIIRWLKDIHNSALEPEIRRFVQDNPGRHGHELEQFVNSRVKHFPKESELPSWILHYTQLRNDEKARLIAKLKTDSINHHLSYLSSVNPRCRDKALEAFYHSPNRYGDEFIIDSYHHYTGSVVQRRSLPSNFIWALAATDTPKIRAFISEVWDKGGDERKKLLEGLRSHSWHHPHMNWLVAKIEQLTQKDERIIGLCLLPHIGTDDAKALLEKWANDPASGVVKEAKWRLEYFDKKQKERQGGVFTQDTIDGLLSGKIKPDDLLVPATAYIWDGEKYIPEKK